VPFSSSDHTSSHSAIRFRLRVAPVPASSRLAWLRLRVAPVRCLLPRRRRSFELPRRFSPLTVPAMDLRVAPNLACFRDLGWLASGFPGALPPLRSPLMQAAGLPQYPCTSGFAGDGSPSRLEFRILRRCRLTDLQVAPNFSPSVSPMIRIRVAPHPSSSGPGWWISESPRIAPSGSPGVDSSGCPKASFPPAFASGKSSSLPESLLSSGRPSGVNLRVAPALHSSGRADGLTNFQVAPNLRSVRAPGRLICELPRSSIFRSLRRRFPGLPRFRAAGWVDDESPIVSNFASSACAADESSCAIRFDCLA